MAKEKEKLNSGYAMISIVAIVAIVALVVMFISMKTGQKLIQPEEQQAMVFGDNILGEAKGGKPGKPDKPGGGDPTPTCSDSDAGIDYYKKGTAVYGSLRLKDVCDSNNRNLWEYYCGDGIIKDEQYFVMASGGIENIIQYKGYQLSDSVVTFEVEDGWSHVVSVAPDGMLEFIINGVSNDFKVLNMNLRNSPIQAVGAILVETVEVRCDCSKSICKNQVLPPFTIAVYDNGPTSDVELSIDIFADLAYDGYYIPVGLAKLFSGIDALILDQEVTLAIYMGEAVIIVGETSPTDHVVFALELGEILTARNIPYQTILSSDVMTSNLLDLFDTDECEIVTTLKDDETKTFTLGGFDYEITAVMIDNNQKAAKVMLNGYTSKRIEVDTSQVLPGASSNENIDIRVLRTSVDYLTSEAELCWKRVNEPVEPDYNCPGTAHVQDYFKFRGIRTKTYTINGFDYEVTVLTSNGGDEKSAHFSVNGIHTNVLTEGESEDLPDGMSIKVLEVMSSMRDSIVEFCLSNLGTSTCTDSDGGVNFFVTGATTSTTNQGGTLSLTDRCVIDSTRGIKEFSCPFWDNTIERGDYFMIKAGGIDQEITYNGYNSNDRVVFFNQGGSFNSSNETYIVSYNNDLTFELIMNGESMPFKLMIEPGTSKIRSLQKPIIKVNAGSCSSSCLNGACTTCACMEGDTQACTTSDGSYGIRTCVDCLWSACRST